MLDGLESANVRFWPIRDISAGDPERSFPLLVDPEPWFERWSGSRSTHPGVDL